MKYWIGVVNKEHVAIGLTEGIMQLGHGKRAPLARLTKDDWLIYYSPATSYSQKDSLQSFTAIGQVSDSEIYQHPISQDFVPYRRKVNYLRTQDVPIRPLIEQLSFIKSKQHWGYVFRFGLIEIPEKDFLIIKEKMIKK